MHLHTIHASTRSTFRSRTAGAFAATAGSLALLAGVLTPGVAQAAVAPAAVAPAAVPAASGWVRLAHLSPNTKSVDVRLTALSGGNTLYELDNVRYGQVSPYHAMPDGIYTVSMVPAGSAPTTKPMISTSVQIDTGKSATVAAYGTNKKLTVSVFTDDLTAPTAGQARVRLIQASTIVKTVDVTTSTGVPIAANAKAGTATGYAQVPAGKWTLALTSAKMQNTAQIDLANGSVTTLLVLDTASGGLTIDPILDSAAVGQMPVGGVQTGGGFLATHPGYLATLGVPAPRFSRLIAR